MKIMLRSGEFCSSTEKKFCYSTGLLTVKLKIDTLLKTFHKSVLGRHCSHTSRILFLFYDLADTFSVLIVYFPALGLIKPILFLFLCVTCISRIKEMRISWQLFQYFTKGSFFQKQSKEHYISD